MTPDERRNECLKLTATWGNTLATAIITVGTFIPIANSIYGFLPPSANLTYVNYGAFGCLVAGLLIHLFGRWILGYLR
jgi:hypothetical protein